MKEATILNMKHDLGKVVQGVHNNMQGVVHLNTLTQGLLETVKRMPGYKEAIEEMLADQKKASDAQQDKKLEL